MFAIYVSMHRKLYGISMISEKGSWNVLIDESDVPVDLSGLDIVTA